MLVDFWATWCGPCVTEMPNVIKVYEKYHARGFEIIGISLDQDREALDGFTRENKMTWRQYFDGQGWSNKVAKAWGVRSIPATYLIGPNGKIRAINLRGDDLDKKVGKLLQ